MSDSMQLFVEFCMPVVVYHPRFPDINYRLLPAYEGGIVFTVRDPRARAVTTIPPEVGG